MVLLAAGLLGAVAVRLFLTQRNRRRFPVREISGFLSDEECDHLIDTARPMLEKSNVLEEGKRGTRSVVRTSATAFLASDPTIEGIKRRIAELTETKLENQEKIQVTFYEPSEFYGLHHDSIRAAGGDPGPAGDRICTVIMYLNDEFTEGLTHFPKLSLRIRPEKGKAVLFHNLTADGKGPHPLGYHAAEPVGTGEKWLSNQWIRQNRRYPAKGPGFRRPRKSR